jgi:hypothetical protein
LKKIVFNFFGIKTPNFIEDLGPDPLLYFQTNNFLSKMPKKNSCQKCLKKFLSKNKSITCFREYNNDLFIKNV